VDNPLCVPRLRTIAAAPLGSPGLTGGTSLLVILNKRRDPQLPTAGAVLSEADGRALTSYARLVGSVLSYIDEMRRMQYSLDAALLELDSSTAAKDGLSDGFF